MTGCLNCEKEKTNNQRQVELLAEVQIMANKYNTWFAVLPDGSYIRADQYNGGGVTMYVAPKL